MAEIKQFPNERLSPRNQLVAELHKNDVKFAAVVIHGDDFHVYYQCDWSDLPVCATILNKEAQGEHDDE